MQPDSSLTTVPLRLKTLSETSRGTVCLLPICKCKSLLAKVIRNGKIAKILPWSLRLISALFQM